MKIINKHVKWQRHETLQYEKKQGTYQKEKIPSKDQNYFRKEHTDTKK